MTTPPDPADPPPCPITGAPGAVLLEDISPKLLTDLWRRGLGVDPAPLHRQAPRIGLWRSPAGLYFFHPAEAGSEAFYRAFYRRIDAYAVFGDTALPRPDFAGGAAFIRPGDRVLDVGAGDGAFAALVPGADYTGIDLHAPPPRPGVRVLAESLADHAARHPGAYDVVCGFQVIEHVADPRGMAAEMVRCLRPGGLLVLAMPRYPSAMALVPNNLLNLPPHHLSWWTEPAAAALCATLGLAPVRIGPVGPGPSDALYRWVARLLPRSFRPGRFVRPGLPVLLTTAAVFLLVWTLRRRLPMPRGGEPNDMLLVARKPAA